MGPSDIIALAVRREREQAKLSLSALASKAGLSKSTLSQIESGHGNPSIETLWSIATALNIPFSSLFENLAPQSLVIRATEGEVIFSDTSKFYTTLLSKCPPMRRRDVYRVSLAQGNRRDAEAHPLGSVEHVVVCSGIVNLGPAGDSLTLGIGDYYRYPADVPHFYESVSEKAMLILVMESGS